MKKSYFLKKQYYFFEKNKKIAKRKSPFQKRINKANKITKKAINTIKANKKGKVAGFQSKNSLKF